MKWPIVGAVIAKELRETLRDRRTLIIMIAVPAFLYPALFVLMEQLALFGQRQLEDNVVRVAVVGTAAERALLASDSALRVVPGSPASPAALRREEVDAVVVFRPPRGPLGTGEARILYDAARDRSSRAREMASARLRDRADSLLAGRLRERGLPGSFAEPLEVRDSSIATPQALGGYALGRFLPMILIVMTILGAFYPAIDLAAGEKERGTLEPLLSTPVGEDDIVAGKFAAVTIIALSAATLNLLSMLLTFQAGLFQFTRALDIQFHVAPAAVALILFTLTLLAILFASLFLGIAVRAQSFREAQNTLTPIYILGFLPALLATMPGIAFTPTLALVPVGGVALLFRALVTGSAPVLPVVSAVGSTIVYAMVALVFATRAFGREEVLFGGGAGGVVRGPLRQRLAAWRAGGTRVPRPAVSLLFVGTVGLLTFYVGSRLQVLLGERGLLLSQWLLLGVPAVLLALLGPYDLRQTLALHRPRPRALGAALLIVLGGLPIGWMLAWVAGRVLQIPEEFLRGLQGLLTADDPLRLAWLFFLIAVTPAVCEELVFRGVLLQGLGREMRMGSAVLLSALVFGAFHLSFETAIRFLPTAWIGLLLGYVVWHTRSLPASMLMHLVNNGVAVALVSSAALQSLVMSGDGEPRWITLATGPVLLAVGVWLLPKREEGTQAAPPPPLSAPEPAAAG